MLLTREIMNRDAITVPATMAVGDLAGLFQRLNIHAAPVLALDGRLGRRRACDDPTSTPNRVWVTRVTVRT